MHLFRAIVTLAITASLIISPIHAHSQRRKPLRYLSLVEDLRIQTPSHRVHAWSSFDLLFDLHQGQQQIKLTLEPNHDIIAEGASVQYLDSNGEVSRIEPIVREDHKVYKGETFVEDDRGHWRHVGWARVVVRRDGIHPLFEGAFTVMNDDHHVQLRSSYMQTKHELDPDAEATDDEYMVVFRGSDVGLPYATELKRSYDDELLSCTADRLHFNVQPNHPVFSNVLRRDTRFWGAMSTASLFGKRQIDTNGIPSGGGNSAGVNLKSTIGQTAGCPNSRKVALVGVATDCGYTGSFNSTEAARQNVITQMNSASTVYEKTFNISLGLHNLTVSDANCPGAVQSSAPWNTACADNTTIQDRLNSFSAWRGTKVDNNSHWTLLTKCNSGAAVGLAWLGQACIATADTSNSNETTTGANVVARTSTEWQVIAHETGHTFGAVHDCTSQTCTDGTTVNAQQCCPLSSSTCDAGQQYIMNPSTGDGITQFSACTVGNICNAIGRNSVKTTCLSDNKGVTTITGSQCGNGIVETGEECDCGGPDICGTENCCDATTCKFKNNAVCDDANDNCCHGCQYATANTVCRASTGQCDPQEVCSGTNGTCPPDVKAPDGQTCGNSSLSLTCASGQCTSRDQQCQTLMGSLTSDNDTYACDSENCQISCASPQFGPNTCYGMQQNFLDGTTCGGGGKCANGQCQGSSEAKVIGSWISNNKGLVIGVASAVGGLLLLSLLSCIWRCCKQRRRRPPGSKIMSPSWGQQPPPYYSQIPKRGQAPTGSNYSTDASHYWQQPPTYPAGPSVRYA
ncbi:MAG: hypothetical protein M1838_000221 [Thelocarpon superellum]|nr:MAG: hypothetical protein M1838_000221 [Thelocarpon superellum]